MTLSNTIAVCSSSELLANVESFSGQNILRCYQCGKCSAGCPVAYAMDMPPRQIMRAVQLGLKSEVLGSSSIWLCVSCETCSVRCPREIDIARVFEALRMIAVKEGIKPAEKDIELFHRVFLDVVERRGRVHELELGARYNLQGRHPFQIYRSQLSLLPGMLSRGKMPIRPTKVRGAGEIRRIFKKVREIEERDSLGGDN